MTAGKSRKKYDGRKALIVKQLAVSFKVSESYVRMAINSDVNNLTTEDIKKEYKRLMAAINNILK